MKRRFDGWPEKPHVGRTERRAPCAGAPAEPPIDRRAGSFGRPLLIFFWGVARGPELGQTPLAKLPSQLRCC